MKPILSVRMKPVILLILLSITSNANASKLLCEAYQEIFEEIYMHHQEGEAKFEFYDKVNLQLKIDDSTNFTRLIRNFHNSVVEESFSAPKIFGYASKRKQAELFAVKNIDYCYQNVAPYMAQAVHEDNFKIVNGQVVESIIRSDSDAYRTSYLVTCTSGQTTSLWVYPNKINWSSPYGGIKTTHGLSISEVADKSCQK